MLAALLIGSFITASLPNIATEARLLAQKERLYTENIGSAGVNVGNGDSITKAAAKSRQLPIDLIGTASTFELRGGVPTGPCNKLVLKNDLRQLGSCNFLGDGEVPEVYELGSLVEYQSIQVRNYMLPSSQSFPDFAELDGFRKLKTLIAVEFGVDSEGNKLDCQIIESLAPPDMVVLCSKLQTDFPKFEPDSTRIVPVKMMFSAEIWAKPAS